MLVLTTTPGDLTKRLDRAQPRQATGVPGNPVMRQSRDRQTEIEDEMFEDWLIADDRCCFQEDCIRPCTVSFLQLQIVSLVEKM